jgi:hypothetical protein
MKIKYKKNWKTKEKNSLKRKIKQFTQQQTKWQESEW